MPPGHLPVRSYLAVPVISRSGEVVGGLFFGHPETGVFTVRAERIAAAIAAQAAIAIDNARLYQAAQREIAERRRVDAALRDSEEQFRMLADSIPQLAWMAWQDGTIFWYNRRWYEYTGTTFEQMQGWGWRSVHDPEYLPQVEARFRQAVENNTNWEDTFPLRGKDGVYRWFLSRAQPIRDSQGHIARWFGTNTDITEQREAEATLRRVNETLEQRVETEVQERLKMEDALRQAQKMEAIGQLTGGVAHDFNNLLAVIMGNAELAKRRGADRVPALMDSILRAGQRGVALTRQLLSFSRRQPAVAQVIDLCREMPRVSEMLKASLRGNIELSVSVAPDTWPIEVDPSELEIALLNVAVNARDAMPDGGCFVIEIGNITLSAGEVWSEPKLSGEHVRIALSDDGAGISPDVLERVFEPFFTTKDVSAGTGLGLSQVYGFAHQSGGAVTIESEHGHGTRVTMYLPRTRNMPGAAAEPGYMPESKSPIPGLVLLVEDNPDVAHVTAMMLRGMGYEVEAVDRGRKALERLEREPPPDLLLSDVVMPEGMSGVHLAREARRRFPGLPIVLMSGYNDAMRDNFASYRVLRKPVSYEQLSETIREHLPAARMETLANK
jgi:PAS domain S-box-containing protein